MPNFTEISEQTGKALLRLIQDGKTTERRFDWPGSPSARHSAAVLCGEIVDDENRLYAGTVYRPVAETLTWEELGPCWLWGGGEIELFPGTKYPADMYGEHTVQTGGGTSGSSSGGDTRNVFLALVESVPSSGTTPLAADCPVWSCNSQATGCVTPDPEDIFSICNTSDEPGSGGFFDPEGNNGDPSCGFWSCDGGETPCENFHDAHCGCDDCYPFWGRGANALDLQSTGVALSCLFACEDGQVTSRQACLVIVPGGPFGVRLALVRQSDGTEIKASTDL